MVGNGPENRDRCYSLTEFDSLALRQTRDRLMVGPWTENPVMMVRVHLKGPSL